MLHILTDSPVFGGSFNASFTACAYMNLAQAACKFIFQKRALYCFPRRSRIAAVTMTGATIAIDDASAADSILSVKQRVFAANRKLSVRRQRLVYSAGPFGMDPLANDETLGGAGVTQDGTAKLDVLLADLSASDASELGEKVRRAIITYSMSSVLI